MLKKVVSGAAGAAKDKLKQRRQHHHHGQGPMSSKQHVRGRYSSTKPSSAAVSLSAVDNAAFEHILDDESDFLAHLDTPPSPPKMQVPARNSKPVDLFDTDMFDSGEFENEVSREEEGENGEKHVNYDPLSGQIVSSPTEEDPRENHGREDEVENGDNSEVVQNEDKQNGNEDEENGNEDEGNGNEDEENGNKEEENGNKEEENGNEVEVIGNGVVESGIVDDSVPGSNHIIGSDAGVQIGQNEIDSDDDGLFDHEPTKPVPNPIPMGTATLQVPGTSESPQHQRDYSESGLSAALSDVSPPSSLPSSLENEMFMSVSSVPVSVQPQDKRSPQDSPPLFPLDATHIGRTTVSASQTSNYSSQIKSSLEPREGWQSEPSEIESELEMLLASPLRVANGASHGPAVENTGGDAPRVRRVSDGEQMGRHLDSGVFEHVDSEGTPERDKEMPRTQQGGASMEDTDALSMQEDHFSSRTINQHSPKATLIDRKVNSSQDMVGRSSATPPLDQVPHGKVLPPKPVIPPPRPPPPSPDAQRKAKSKQPSSSLSKDGRLSPAIARHQSKLSQRSIPHETTLEEEDDLFPGDARRVQEYLNKDLKESPVVSGDEGLLGEDRQQLSELELGAATEADKQHAPLEEKNRLYLTLPYHLLLSLLLYLYYSLNIFPYLAGLFAGFFTLFLFLGSVFIYYVHFIENKPTKEQESRKVELSEDFVQLMRVDFNKLKQYQSNRFTATLTYDHTTHHPKERMSAELKLADDFKFFVQVVDENNITVLINMVDIRECSITIEPQEVAQNRKRRWSKKFPIVITCNSEKTLRTFKVYLFSPTAREKEDWFRRLRSAADGVTSLQLIRQQKQFFAYMHKYFPATMLQTLSLYPTRRQSAPLKSSSGGRSGTAGSRKSAHQRHLVDGTCVQFSKAADMDEFSDNNESSVGVNITRPKGQTSPDTSSNRHSTSPSLVKSRTPPPPLTTRSLTATTSPPKSPTLSLRSEDDFEIVDPPSQSLRRQMMRRSPNRVSPLSTSMDLWLNSVAARLCWDIWHEQRWKDWIMTRIQKKLIKVKTPSFMEKLHLMDIAVGNDMPIVKRLVGGPRLDLQGIWIYLDVTYQGRFVMTIETKMKLGHRDAGEQRGEEGRKMTTMTKKEESGPLPMSSPLSPSEGTRYKHSMSHTRAARALGGGVEEDEEEEIDSGSDDEDQRVLPHPLMEEALAEVTSQDSQPISSLTEPSSNTAVAAPPSKGRIKSMMYSMAKKVANTKFVQRAAEKVSSYPLVLTVEVMQLDGILAVNIPPPSTDTIWWGFHGKPRLELVAKPKLGNREVKLAKVTHWIEKKLCDIVNKKLVLPEMEDLVIPLLNSGMREDKQRPISTESTETMEARSS